MKLPLLRQRVNNIKALYLLHDENVFPQCLNCLLTQFIAAEVGMLTMTYLRGRGMVTVGLADGSGGSGWAML